MPAGVNSNTQVKVTAGMKPTASTITMVRAIKSGAPTRYQIQTAHADDVAALEFSKQAHCCFSLASRLKGSWMVFA